jgi:Flp pilus assembly protein TadD
VASWQARQGDAQAARHTLDAFAEQSPDLAIALPGLERDAAQRQVRRPTDGMADAYFALASALRDQDAADFAALMARLALDLRPDLTAARLLSSDMLSEAKHPDDALKALEPVAADDPLAPVVDLRRASLLDELGRGNEAVALLNRMELRLPDRPEPWALQGSIMSGQHRYAEAVAAFDQAVRRVHTPTRANWPLFYERGIALDRAGRWTDAQADFQHALQLSPEQPDVLNYLAYSWTEQGRHLAQAKQMLDRAVSQRPNDGAIIDSLGWLDLRQGDVAAAVRQLEHAVELEPEDATINGHLGDAYDAAGRHREALFQWRLALTLNPEPDDTARLKAKLRQAGVTDQVGTAAAAKVTQ